MNEQATERRTVIEFEKLKKKSPKQFDEMVADNNSELELAIAELREELRVVCEQLQQAKQLNSVDKGIVNRE